jgi:N-acetyl-gamma-glutamyl-phosphate reductase
MQKTTVSVIGITSYTGLELLRFLAQHPHFEVRSVTGRSMVGKAVRDVFPQLDMGGTLGEIAALEITEEPEQTELAFVCLPHAAAAETVVKLLERGMKVVDLSADFRLHDAGIYEEWYRHVHPAPALLEEAVYGLCEHHRERLASASLVANPGCFATASILALAPALARGIIEPAAIIDAKSGVSGAGRGQTLGTHYAEANEDMNAYALSGHRHLPEISQELTEAAQAGGHTLQEPLRLTFIPHLAPMTRGILATCYADLRRIDSVIPTSAEIQSLYKEYYANEPFIHIVNQGPHTKWSYGSNHCFIYPFVDTRTARLIVVSCLDNLVKGASGQAIQNANLLCGYDETTGLTMGSIYP